MYDIHDGYAGSRFGRKRHIPQVDFAEGRLMIRLTVGDHNQFFFRMIRHMNCIRIGFKKAPVQIQRGIGQEEDRQTAEEAIQLLFFQQLIHNVVQRVFMREERLGFAKGMNSGEAFVDKGGTAAGFRENGVVMMRQNRKLFRLR